MDHHLNCLNVALCTIKPSQPSFPSIPPGTSASEFPVKKSVLTRRSRLRLRGLRLLDLERGLRLRRRSWERLRGLRLLLRGLLDLLRLRRRRESRRRSDPPPSRSLSRRRDVEPRGERERERSRRRSLSWGPFRSMSPEGDWGSMNGEDGDMADLSPRVGGKRWIINYYLPFFLLLLELASTKRNGLIYGGRKQINHFLNSLVRPASPDNGPTFNRP